MNNDLDILEQINQTDASKVETSFPILKGGLVRFNVAACKWEKGDKANDKGQIPTFLAIELRTAQDWSTQPRDGFESKPVKPNFPVFHRIYVGFYEDKKTGEQKTYGLEGESGVYAFRQSAFGPAAPGTKFQPEDMIGQEVTANLKFDPAPKNEKTGETLRPRSEITAFIAKKVS